MQLFFIRREKDYFILVAFMRNWEIYMCVSVLKLMIAKNSEFMLKLFFHNALNTNSIKLLNNNEALSVWIFLLLLLYKIL